ncbi:hypothetical protein [Micromonospora ureilytica]|nr:hypothetical protein [Micromonospora ureilytica]
MREVSGDFEIHITVRDHEADALYRGHPEQWTQRLTLALDRAWT